MSASIAELKKGSGKGKTKFPRLTEGVHLGRILQVVMLGLQSTERYEEKGVFDDKERMIITFEIPDERIVGEDSEGVAFDKPKVITKEMGVSMHEKATLYKYVAALIPNASSIAELLNVPCMVQVGSTKTGNAKVAGVMAAPSGVPVPELEETNRAIFYDFDNHVQADFDDLWEWQRDKIKAAVNWKEPEEAAMPEV